eukprot:10454478-Lingulodinium_polyedra.AAC.1
MKARNQGQYLSACLEGGPQSIDDKRGVANRNAEDIQPMEALVPAQELGRKAGAITLGRVHRALGKGQLEVDVGHRGLQCQQSRGGVRHRAQKVDIIQVGLNSDRRVGSMDRLEATLEGGGKVQGSQGVPLLGARPRQQAAASAVLHDVNQLAGLAVAHGCPSVQVLEGLHDGRKHAGAGQTVERVVAVDLDDSVGGVGLEVGLHRMDEDIRPAWSRHPQLGRHRGLTRCEGRAEKGTELGRLLAADHFAHELAEHLTAGDRAHLALGGGQDTLEQSEEASAR